MSTYPPIEIAKPGRAVATNGQAVEFTPEILADLAESYDPTLHEAPLVVGHPKMDDPAYGSVGLVKWDLAAQRLNALPSHVDPAFAEIVNAKHFNRVSMSVYLPDSPSNPLPGHYYLRHVGFLGAQAPAIKGLRPVSFSEADEGVVEFGDWQTFSVMRGLLGMAGRFRDWVLTRDGQDAADQIISRDDLDWLNRSVAEAEIRESMEDRVSPANYSEKPEEQPMSGTQTTAEFAERETALNAKEQQLVERQAALDRKTAELKKREVADFAEGLIKAGKVLPRDQAGLVEFMAGLPDGATLEFGEGADRKTLPSRQWLESFLMGLPNQVDFGEFDKGGSEELGAANSNKVIADRATAYKNKLSEQGVHISFAEAVDGVRANEDR
jgi:hypothetical protein